MEQSKIDRINELARKKKTEGLTALIRQGTWLAAIVAGAWVIVTIINLFK